MRKILILFIVIIISCSTNATQLGVEEVLVQGGTFRMGSNYLVGKGDWENTIAESETPIHTVTLESYYISKYEVNQFLYKKIMETNPSYRKGDELPVVSVTWYDAVTFCNLLSEKKNLQEVYSINGTQVTMDITQNGYRLPTEAEWEYAARSRGRDDREWSGTNTKSKLGKYAWYSINSYFKGKNHPNYGINKVGTKYSNDIGIFDMSGNVWEWCWDWHNDYSINDQTNPIGPQSGDYRVIRGGGWSNIERQCRTACRPAHPPSSSMESISFRFARNYIK